MVDRVRVASDPVRVIVAGGGETAVVASTWSRRLTFVSLWPQAPEDTAPSLSVVGEIVLPFSPRELAAVAGGSRVVAADAFGGRLAVIEPVRREIASTVSVPAHNIRGMAVSPDGRTLRLTHQVLNRLAQTSFDDVHWGQLIRNHVRELRVDALLAADSDASVLDGGRLFDLGDVGYAAGDPGAIAPDGRGGLIVAIEGVDEVAIAAAVDQGPRRVVVGRRRLNVAVGPDGQFAYVADSLDDTISVVAIATGQRPATIALGPRPDLSAIDRGERLFSAARLSHDGWMSCQSCHTDGHSNGLASDTLGDGSYGAPKRVPTLLGVAATGPWTWTGSKDRLEEQVRQSITTTMHGTKADAAQVADLTAYVGSLVPPSGPRDVDGSAVARGREVFRRKSVPAATSRPSTPRPGPSTSGWSTRSATARSTRRRCGPSAVATTSSTTAAHRSLRDVFAAEHHPRGLELSPREIDDLVAFLGTL